MLMKVGFLLCKRSVKKFLPEKENINLEWEHHLVVCMVVISDTGYINSDLFVVWLQGFIDVVKPSIDSKVVLVLDGHTTHSKNLKAVQLARQHGVIMLQLPGHTTHRLQPLDVAVFKPLEGYYNQAVEKWMREHAGLGVTQFQVAQILGEAYPRAATIANAINGFRKCGIWPVDRNVFRDVDFAPSLALQEVSTSNGVEVNNTSHQDSDTSDNDGDIPLSEVVKQMQSPRVHISFENIIPMPNVKEVRNNRKSKGPQKSQTLTSTPYKDELEARASVSGQDKRCSVRRRIGSTSPKPNTSGMSAKQSSKRTKMVDAVIEINAEEWYCQMCDECRVENMIQCIKCQKWSHESCVAFVSPDHTCDICKS
ncbi:hypothetical protein PPYR_00707 [Photinus pyralis]|uniref:DDE-1 domain-containing protein n=1 Tax=Photinus pyralis TaxID=7054 RepID=A0A5N4B2B3_PHOPY|nr:hypothetical protein PPYR_00707 [Photinus pyralis]